MLLKPEELEKVLIKLRPWCLVAAANEWDMLMSHMDSLSEGYKDTAAKLQYVIDWMGKNGMLSEHMFTFPDGDSWYASKGNNDASSTI